MSGVWAGCGGGYCLDGQPLDLGAPGMGNPADGDFDLDGVIETYGEEFTGLENTSPQLVVIKGGGPWVVYAINGKSYLDG